MRMFVTDKMFTDANGKVSTGFTNITGTASCTRKLVNDSQSKAHWDEILGPKPTLDLN